ncbi:hypothetical protein Tco_0164176 [Tanacetum coccineum]
MVDMVNQRKKHFAEERAKEKRNKPMTQSQLRIYMSNYLKNQGTWKLSHLKKLKFEENKEEFDKYGDEIDLEMQAVEPMAKVTNNVDYNVFVAKKQHIVQPEFISDTYVMEKDDNIVTPNSSDMSHNRGKVD